MTFPPETHANDTQKQADEGEDTSVTEASALSDTSSEKADDPRLSFPSSGGVFLLTDAQGRMIQLAAAADLRRALSNRLLPSDDAATEAESGETPQAESTPEESMQKSAQDSTAEGSQDADTACRHIPTPRKRMNLQEIVERIYWRPAHSVFEITFEYYRLARRIMPDNYMDNVAFGPCWFVHVDPSAHLPRFRVNKYLQGSPGTDLGPFATQSGAGRFVQILEDAFDLCRRYHILEKVPHGQACAYFEMGKCPAPCDGSISLSAYRGMVSDALRFATGEREKWYDHWEKLMKAAAAEQAFEQAAHHKQRLDRAREIEQNAFQLVRPVEQFNYLVLQRGSTRSRIQPFFVTAGVIHPGEQVRLKELDQVAGDWTARMHGEAGKTLTENGSQEEGVCDLPSRSEQIWLVSHFLLKKDDPGLLIHEAHLPEPDELADKTRRHFAPQKPSAGPQSGQSGAES